MTDIEFEKYWRENRIKILHHNEEYEHAKENFKISNGYDLLLFGIPVVAGAVFMNNVELSNELLLWLSSTFVTVLCFAICAWIKSIVTGSDSPDEVEERIKCDIKKKLVRIEEGESE